MKNVYLISLANMLKSQISRCDRDASPYYKLAHDVGSPIPSVLAILRERLRGVRAGPISPPIAAERQSAHRREQGERSHPDPTSVLASISVTSSLPVSSLASSPRTAPNQAVLPHGRLQRHHDHGHPPSPMPPLMAPARGKLARRRRFHVELQPIRPQTDLLLPRIHLCQRIELPCRWIEVLCIGLPPCSSSVVELEEELEATEVEGEVTGASIDRAVTATNREAHHRKACSSVPPQQAPPP